MTPVLRSMTFLGARLGREQRQYYTRHRLDRTIKEEMLNLDTLCNRLSLGSALTENREASWLDLGHSSVLNLPHKSRFVEDTHSVIKDSLGNS